MRKEQYKTALKSQSKVGVIYRKKLIRKKLFNFFGKKLFFLFFGIFLLVLLAYFLIKNKENSLEDVKVEGKTYVIDPPKLKKIDISSIEEEVLSEGNEAVDKVIKKPYVLKYKVKKGETLSSILGSKGVSFKEVHNLTTSLKKILKSKKSIKIFPTQNLEFKIGKNDEILFFKFDLDKTSFVTCKRNPSNEAFIIKKHIRPTKNVKHTVSGVINSSFAEAANVKNVPYDIVDDLVDLYGSRIIFHKDFRKGDKFKLVYEQEELEDKTPLPGAKLKMALLTVNSKEWVAIGFKGTDKRERFFNKKGELIGNTFLRYPLRFSRISSVFTDSRLHPITKRRTPHYGVDFAAPRGTPIRAAADGVVLFAGRKGANGIMIKLKHGPRYKTAYCHLSRISKGIRKNVRVKRGQVIGKVGSTGRSTGPHLHYAFYDRNKYVDPLKVKLPLSEELNKGTSIPKKYLSESLKILRAND